MAITATATSPTGSVAIRCQNISSSGFQTYRAVCIGAGLRWNAELRANVGPTTSARAALARLKAEGFEVQVDAQILGELVAEQAATQAAKAAVLGELPSGLYPFQAEGVAWLHAAGSAILADEMGLGKTPQVLALVAALGAPAIVIAPASVKLNWAREARRWAPDHAVRVENGRADIRQAPQGREIVLLNWDIQPAQGWTGLQPGTVLALDEAHYAKSPKAARTVRARALAEAVRAAGGRVIPVTGTPALGHQGETWEVLELTGRTQEIGRGRYQKAMGGEWVQVWAGPSKGYINQLVWTAPPAGAEHILRSVMLRRNRANVLDLPAKTRQFLPVNGLSAGLRKRLDKLQNTLALPAEGTVEDALAVLEARKAKIGFEEMSSLRAELAAAMIPALLELVEQYEEAGEPLVVFSAHRAPVDQFKGREGWAVITGDVPVTERQAIVEQFQAGALKGVALTIGAGREGLTLTRAANMVFVDLDWSPALNNQAEDRICRIGQTRSCLYRIMVADHPVCVRLAEILAAKDQVLGVIERQGQTTEADLTEADLAPPPAPPEPKKDEAVPVMQKPRWGRAPQNPVEEWAASSLLYLADMSPDGASLKNNVGFNGRDAGFGRSLARQLAETGGLSDKQWAAAVKMCKTYHNTQCPGYPGDL